MSNKKFDIDKLKDYRDIDGLFTALYSRELRTRILAIKAIIEICEIGMTLRDNPRLFKRWFGNKGIRRILNVLRDSNQTIRIKAFAAIQKLRKETVLNDLLLKEMNDEDGNIIDSIQKEVVANPQQTKPIVSDTYCTLLIIIGFLISGFFGIFVLLNIKDIPFWFAPVAWFGLALFLAGVLLVTLGNPDFREEIGSNFLLAEDGSRLTAKQYLVAAMLSPVTSLIGFISGTIGAAISLVGVASSFGSFVAPEGYVWRSTGGEFSIFAFFFSLFAFLAGIGVCVWLYNTFTKHFTKIPKTFGAIILALSFISTIVLVIWFRPS
jgi:hypothetical protein